MREFTAVIILVSSITAFAKVRFSKKHTEIEAYDTVYFGNRPTSEDLASMLDTFRWGSRNVAIIDMDSSFSYKLVDVSLKDVKSMQMRYDSKYELGDDKKTVLQIVKTAAGQKVVSGTASREIISEFGELRNFGYNIIFFSGIVSVMCWKDISKTDGLVVLGDSTRIVLYSSKAIKEFKFAANFSKVLESTAVEIGCSTEQFIEAATSVGCWNTPDNYADVTGKGFDAGVYFQAVEEHLVTPFAELGALIEKVRAQKQSASLELCGPASDIVGLSRKLSSVPFTISDKVGLGISVTGEVEQSGTVLAIQKAAAALRDGVMNFCYSEPVDDEKVEKLVQIEIEENLVEEDDEEVIQEPEVLKLEGISIDVSKIKPRKNRNKKRLMLDTGSEDRVLVAIEDSIRAAYIRKANMLTSLMFLGISLLVVGIIGFVGSMGLRTSGSIDIGGLESRKSELLQLIDAKGSYQQISSRQIDNYLPYIEFVGGLTSTDISISELNLIGDSSLMITGNCKSKDQYNKFEQGLRNIDTGLELVVTERTETSDGVSFRFEVTRGG